MTGRDLVKPGTGPAQPWRLAGDGVYLSVRLTPKASRDLIVGIGDDPHLVVKVRALPSEGRRRRVGEIVAQWLGVPPRDVVLARGGKSRLKTMHIAGDPERLADLLRAKLASL